MKYIKSLEIVFTYLGNFPYLLILFTFLFRQVSLNSFSMPGLMCVSKGIEFSKSQSVNSPEAVSKPYSDT